MKTFEDIKKIAVLGGSTTHDIISALELFLLDQGIEPEFYESEYAQFYQDAMFGNEELDAFRPDVVFIHTSTRNINVPFPAMSDDETQISANLDAQVKWFAGMWDRLKDKFSCPIIQNNFEKPYYRLLGNRDVYDIHGKVNFISRLNQKFAEYAQSHENFYLCDVDYISSDYGLKEWSDPFYFHMYKYALNVNAVPYLSFNVANIIKSIYGKNKKAFNLDLDNTLWGGIIGDDGAENIEIGQETPISQIYSEFQSYIKLCGDMGVVLTVNSKNEESIAESGFERPDSVLKKDDFASFKANWNPKSMNLSETASELSLLPESFVFVDDNPAERAIIEEQLEGVSVPDIDGVEHYIRTIDRSGFFEVTNLTWDDIKRNEMYLENAKRRKLEASFSDYEDYLKSLDMKAEIKEFSPMYMARIAQLTNKSNQFNLTTKRYSQNEIEEIAKDPGHITLYGKLEDRFGDNGVVSVIIGRIYDPGKDELHIELWLMSCRVLKRDMEYAMMDELANRAHLAGIKKIIGYYYPTEKNKMVRDFYALQGFDKISEDEAGASVWEFEIGDDYEPKQHVIRVNL